MRPTSVFVGGLGDDLTKEDLEREFSKYGKLSNVWVAQNPPGFAFVEYDDREDADEAVKEMNGTVLNGSQIRVEISRNNGRSGRGRGGGGRGYRGGRDGGFRGRGGGGYGGYGSSRRGGYDSGYGGSSRYGSGRDTGSSRYGSGYRNDQYDSPSYGGGASNDYRSSNYRSRSPVSNRNGNNW